MKKRSFEALNGKSRRESSLEDIASGLLVDMIKKAGGIDLMDIDSLASHIYEELKVVATRQPKRWPKDISQHLERIVVGELNRLLRQQRLVIAGNRTCLCLKVNDQAIKLAHSQF